MHFSIFPKYRWDVNQHITVLEFNFHIYFFLVLQLIVLEGVTHVYSFSFVLPLQTFEINIIISAFSVFFKYVAYKVK